MSPPTLPRTLAAWGTPAFEKTAKSEIGALGAAQLPLQQGLAHSSHVSSGPLGVVLLSAGEVPAGLRLKAGIFYEGIQAGCACTNDPTPENEITEYCEVWIEIERPDARARITLLEDQEATG